MLFCQATLFQCKAILDILKLFMDALGTQINKSKSNVLFFNTTPQSKRFLTRTLGFSMGTLPSKYLGMLLSENSLKSSGWKALITIIQKQMLNWSFRDRKSVV